MKCLFLDRAKTVLKYTSLLNRLNETVKTLKEAEASVGTSDNFGAFSVDAERAIHALENMSFRKGQCP